MRKGGKWNPYVYIAYYNIFKSKSIFYLTIYGYKKKILLFFETKSFFFFLSFFFLSAIKHTRSLSVERRSINTWKHTRLMSKLKRVNYKLQKFQKKKKKGPVRKCLSSQCVYAIYIKTIFSRYRFSIPSLCKRAIFLSKYSLYLFLAKEFEKLRDKSYEWVFFIDE